ncbi:hypothetical protein Lalb_Chr15g0076771 [Lupinus albus]|uniref:Uncharacterized protein n=1 Tax=Lupinus albus TaxID=3870 RepID=A0A6A4NZV3_LUPAL|nr:hypothetical protein Lalb_Chr15g0076771 [Lupinus albus]
MQLLRTILHKKIYSKQQNSCEPSSMNKCLEDKKIPKKRKDDEAKEKVIDGCKWVKTDSEYIVLEI